MTDRPYIFAVDFDGTLCDSQYPGTGTPNTALIRYLIRHWEQGADLILWTCRTGDALTVAVDWCHEHGLCFAAVNCNTPRNIEYFGEDMRKVVADCYIDDKALGVSEFWTMTKERGDD